MWEAVCGTCAFQMRALQEGESSPRLIQIFWGRKSLGFIILELTSAVDKLKDPLRVARDWVKSVSTHSVLCRALGANVHLDLDMGFF